MTPEERDVFIKQYAAGYDEVIDALNNFPAESLGAHPIPGKRLFITSATVKRRRRCASEDCFAKTSR
jgi:hypothetical protein